MKWWPRRWRIYHVPRGTWYAIGNSRVGIAIAVALGFRYIDMDAHVTKDGVPVIGHWDMILKDHFILPDWFTDKYGENPRVRKVEWADLQRLRTSRVSYRGRNRRYHYITVRRAMRLISRRRRLRLALEVKGSEAFEDKATFERIELDRATVGLPKSRMVVMTLQNLGHPLRRLKAAKAAGFTTVLLARGKRPRDFDTQWAPHIDYVRGRWTR